MKNLGCTEADPHSFSSPPTKAHMGIVAVKADPQATVVAPVAVQVTSATVAVENKPVEAHEAPTIGDEHASSTQAPTQKRKWTRAKIVFLVIFGIASALVLVMLITTLVFNWKAPKPQYLHR
ncbi:hypothetical protein AAVH_05265 [Aphelenchoides avenae]|nr:hypothetical protein AAVH_05265 [Aphelenchus avenae]